MQKKEKIEPMQVLTNFNRYQRIAATSKLVRIMRVDSMEDDVRTWGSSEIWSILNEEEYDEVFRINNSTGKCCLMEGCNDYKVDIYSMKDCRLIHSEPVDQVRKVLYTEVAGELFIHVKRTKDEMWLDSGGNIITEKKGDMIIRSSRGPVIRAADGSIRDFEGYFM